MSAKQILIAAAGVGGGPPPPPAGPAFDPPATGFSMFGSYMFPSFIFFSPIEYIDFTSAGGITIYNTAPVPASGPTSWDTTGGTYAATTGVTFNVSLFDRIPISGFPFIDVQIAGGLGPPFPGSYIIDPGGGGLGSGATLGLDLVNPGGAGPGDAVRIVILGSIDLVDTATRSTVFSSATFAIDITVNFM